MGIPCLAAEESKECRPNNGKLYGSILGSHPIAESERRATAPVAISLDRLTEVPEEDGQKANILRWAESNAQIMLRPGETWDFCAQTYATGWDQYQPASEVWAGGICFNASMLRELAGQNTELLEVVTWSPHPPRGWPRLHTAVYCPGRSLTLRNRSANTLAIIWQAGSDQISVSLEVVEAEAGGHPSREVNDASASRA